jgi:hypothetical protein
MSSPKKLPLKANEFEGHVFLTFRRHLRFLDGIWKFVHEASCDITSNDSRTGVKTTTAPNCPHTATPPYAISPKYPCPNSGGVSGECECGSSEHHHHRNVSGEGHFQEQIPPPKEANTRIRLLIYVVFL